MTIQDDITRRSADIQWPDGLTPTDADLFAHNEIVISAPPPQIWRHLIAATAWGFSTVQLKKLGPIDPFVLNGWLGLFVAIELAVLSVAIEGSPLGPIAAATWRGWSGLLYTGLISTIVAFGLWAKLVARYSVSQTLPFMLTVPLFAIVGGIVLNGDRMTTDIIAGGLHEFVDDLQIRLNLIGTSVFDTFFAIRPMEPVASQSQTQSARTP